MGNFMGKGENVPLYKVCRRRILLLLMEVEKSLPLKQGLPPQRRVERNRRIFLLLTGVHLPYGRNRPAESGAVI